jgi:hypothetical protein
LRRLLPRQFLKLDSVPPTSVIRREEDSDSDQPFKELIHIDNHDNKNAQPLIPFYVIIILLVVAVIIGVFATICCWRARKRRAAAAAQAAGSSTAREDGRPRYQIPTLVFQQHEPDTHGFFAPLYLDPHASGGVVDGVFGETAKRELKRIYAPEMMARRQRKDTDTSVKNGEVVKVEMKPYGKGTNGWI